MRIYGLKVEEIDGTYYEVVEVSYYYDETREQEYSEDPEGNLVNLCWSCAKGAGDDVEHAGEDSCIDLRCNLCGVYNGEILEHVLGYVN